MILRDGGLEEFFCQTKLSPIRMTPPRLAAPRPGFHFPTRFFQQGVACTPGVVIPLWYISSPSQPSVLAEKSANVGQFRNSHFSSRLVRLAKFI